MIVAESRRGRRLVGRLDRGSELLEALAEVCRQHGVRAGEIRAMGALEQVVLGEHDQKTRAPRATRRFDAAFEILSLYGNISERDGKLSLQARASLSRERDNGIEVVGGQILSGRVFAVEFVIDAFDDLLLRRSTDPQTGLSLWREAIALGPPVAAAAPTHTTATAATTAPAPQPEAPAAAVAHLPFDAPARTEWKDVVAASQHQAPPPARAPEPEPEVARISDDDDTRVLPGDYIEHPKFGRCQVERVEGDYEFVSARLRNQRLIRLSLDVLTLIFVGKEGEHQLFRAESAR